MKGTITWSCVNCLCSRYDEIKIKFFSYDPGSTYSAVWSFFIPYKRRVNIRTICRACLGEIGHISPQEQKLIILKKRDQWNYKQKVSWVKQEWNFWITCDECQQINESLTETGEVHVHLSSNMSIN